MDLVKLTKDELRTFEVAKLREVAEDIRRELVMQRMDLYKDQKKQSGDRRVLRRNLARALTFKTQRESESRAAGQLKNAKRGKT